MKRLVQTFAAAGILMCMNSVAHAWTVDGYVTGGGMSASSCSFFLEDMATARQVGLGSDRGRSIMFSWLQHMTGFVTGYNMADPGTFDLVAVSRSGGMLEVNTTLLNVADQYCRANPTETFVGALTAIVQEFYPSSDRGPTQ